MKSKWFVILLCMLFGLTFCSSGVRYYIGYNEDLNAFSDKDEISKSDARGGSFYEVYYSSGRINYYNYYKNDKLFSKHVFVYDDAKYPIIKKNLDLKNKINSIEYYDDNNGLNKVVKYDQKGQIASEEMFKPLPLSSKDFYPDYNIGKSYLDKKIDYFNNQNKKNIFYYQYFVLEKKLHQKILKMEEYSNNMLINKYLYFYNNSAIKYKVESYNLNKLNKITFYNRNDIIEEEHLFDDKGKLSIKRYFNRLGKLVKEDKN
ncbi:MAG: hypothetical protein OEV44_04320 [Spirochaetota bacterium]|nr:hypothetical protein [Spirochaetota bacterium]